MYRSKRANLDVRVTIMQKIVRLKNQSMKMRRSVGKVVKGMVNFIKL